MLWLPEVRRIMTSVMAVSLDDIHPETIPNALPAWDSLTHLMLVVALELELGVSFASDEIERMTSVGAICGVVGSKLGA
jgi:acyl carrier protein